MSRVVRARYEKGVLKLLDEVDLDEGEEVVIRSVEISALSYASIGEFLERVA